MEECGGRVRKGRDASSRPASERGAVRERGSMPQLSVQQQPRHKSHCHHGYRRSTVTAFDQRSCTSKSLTLDTQLALLTPSGRSIGLRKLAPSSFQTPFTTVSCTSQWLCKSNCSTGLHQWSSSDPATDPANPNARCAGLCEEQWERRGRRG